MRLSSVLQSEQYDAWGLAAASVSLDAHVEEGNEPLVKMAGAGDQHNGGQASGKALQSTAREIDYLNVVHGALTDVWRLDEDRKSGISWAVLGGHTFEGFECSCRHMQFLQLGSR
jgi:hypothetical protein